MPLRLWQTLAIIGATVALVFALGDALDFGQYTDDHLVTNEPDAAGWRYVISVSGNAHDTGGIRPGDLIRSPDGQSMARERFSNDPAGTIESWQVQRGARQFETRSVVAAANADDIAYGLVVNTLRILMLAVAVVVIIRRSDLAEVRALAIFLIAFAFSLFSLPAWLPDACIQAVAAIRIPIQIIGLGYATMFACLFPTPSASGPRAFIGRVNMPLTLTLAVVGEALWLARYLLPHAPSFEPFASLVKYSPYYYIIAMTAAFTIGTRAARGADRPRALWASGSLLVGFAGPIVSTVARLGFNVYPAWLHYVELSLVAIPLGLAYSILRHRTIDIGFVISRALVLTAVSFIVIAALGLLERALGKLFIDASHIASRTVEIALALGLGFSLRALHVRVERFVDFVFFRSRRRAAKAMLDFQQDMFYINDPAIVMERTVAVLEGYAGSSHVTILGETAIADNDPLYVRLRAAREPVALRNTGTALAGEYAFPMMVRGAFTGALVVGAKRSGETYDPEERELIAGIALRVGFALDALQSLAIRRELDELKAQLTPLPRPLVEGGASATGGAASAF